MRLIILAATACLALTGCNRAGDEGAANNAAEAENAGFKVGKGC